MTLNALIKRLQKLQSAGFGRAKVTVDKSSLSDGNGCWEVCDILSLSCEQVAQADGDGGIKSNRDGSESSRLCVVFSGEVER